ncbi:hypothetical protein HPULCUR_003479 [Helicostylum pulchrum]|uniref:SprT-like domain-containing protein n=1 Tax=Helicostylum pulchrum TaxID=562976 RepID=A0ABP9XTH5_9FUNG
MDSDEELSNRKQHQYAMGLIPDGETPDVRPLFLYFNKKYFDNKLNHVEVEWSDQLTTSAGYYTQGCGLPSIVQLSTPLLNSGTKKDVIEVLLHEMIHAFLFLTDPYYYGVDEDEHGPQFLEQAGRINEATGYTIFFYHIFEDEADISPTHAWQCNGKCWEESPNSGPPDPNSASYKDHQLKCGGTYKKIEIPGHKQKKTFKNILYQYIKK